MNSTPAVGELAGCITRRCINCPIIRPPDRAAASCARKCSKAPTCGDDFSRCAAQKSVDPVQSHASSLLRKGISPFRRVTGVSSLNSAAPSGAAFLLRRKAVAGSCREATPWGPSCGVCLQAHHSFRSEAYVMIVSRGREVWSAENASSSQHGADPSQDLRATSAPFSAMHSAAVREVPPSPNSMLGASSKTPRTPKT
jgi:hypothetical protein